MPPCWLHPTVLRIRDVRDLHPESNLSWPTTIVDWTPVRPGSRVDVERLAELLRVLPVPTERVTA